MMLGREVTLPFEIINQSKGITGGEETEKEAAHTQKIRERMQRAHNLDLYPNWSVLLVSRI
jgi:hypothetical protein